MKKLNSKNTTVIIISIIIILFACQKTKVDNITPPATVTGVTASVEGRVTDLNNAPLSGASVAAGASNTTTDANGEFTLKDIQLDKDAGFVKVTKAGYFTGSRTFLVNGNTTNNIKIQMIPKTVSGNFAAASGGNINVSGGGAVNFASSSVVNAASGVAYIGDVSVATFYLNPAAANFKDYMPGDLRGTSTSNKAGILQSFGMTSIEMNDPGGQKLQLASGKTATVTIPISSALQATAPSTISLWYFDETNGIWKEEGTATKQNTNYIGTVAHFSFWTAGQLGADVRLDATLKSNSGIVLANKLVTITSANLGTTSGYTDNTGTLSGLVPANETLVMNVFNDCGGSIYKKNIGPFSTDTNLGSIDIAGNNLFSSLENYTITGTVINCSNTPVASGQVILVITGDDTVKSIIVNGSFSMVFNRCNNLSTSVTVFAYDSIKNQFSTAQTITLAGGNQNIGQISFCSNIPPVAAFTYAVSGTTIAATVTFSNLSTNAVSYLWDFGDGTASNQQSLSHLYTTAGDYVVKLVATGTGGIDSTTETIHISAAAIDSSFIHLTLNGLNYSWVPSDLLSASRIDSITHYDTQIKGGNTASTYFFLGLDHDNAAPGTYSSSLYTILNGTAYNSYNQNSIPLANITEYGPVGGYVTGTATGWVKNFPTATTDSFAFSCSFSVKRIQ